MATMLIGGLWHGASWTFVVWGGLHGLLLIANNLLRIIFPPRGTNWNWVKRLVVFLLVSLVWVFFRAENFPQALAILSAAVFPEGSLLKSPFHIDRLALFDAMTLFPCLFFIALVMPNLYEWMAYFRPAKDFVKERALPGTWLKKSCWRPRMAYCCFILALFFIAFGNIDQKNEFIYFRF